MATYSPVPDCKGRQGGKGGVGGGGGGGPGGGVIKRAGKLVTFV